MPNTTIKPTSHSPVFKGPTPTAHELLEAEVERAHSLLSDLEARFVTQEKHWHERLSTLEARWYERVVRWFHRVLSCLHI